MLTCLTLTPVAHVSEAQVVSKPGAGIGHSQSLKLLLDLVEGQAPVVALQVSLPPAPTLVAWETALY